MVLLIAYIFKSEIVPTPGPVPNLTQNANGGVQSKATVTATEPDKAEGAATKSASKTTGKEEDLSVNPGIAVWNLPKPTWLPAQTAEQEQFVYDGNPEFLDYWLNAAGIVTNSTTHSTMRLPSTFVGRKLTVISFTSFEGATVDQDWFGHVEDKDLAGDAPSPRFIQPRLDAPVIYGPGDGAELGRKSLNFAPPKIPPVPGLAAISAAKFGRKIVVSKAKTVWLRFAYGSDTNPRPASVHNCESALAIIFSRTKLVDKDKGLRSFRRREQIAVGGYNLVISSSVWCLIHAIGF